MINYYVRCIIALNGIIFVPDIFNKITEKKIMKANIVEKLVGKYPFTSYIVVLILNSLLLKNICDIKQHVSATYIITNGIVNEIIYRGIAYEFLNINYTSHIVLSSIISTVSQGSLSPSLFMYGVCNSLIKKKHSLRYCCILNMSWNLFIIISTTINET
jgi:hypothetical protein